MHIDWTYKPSVGRLQGQATVIVDGNHHAFTVTALLPTDCGPMEAYQQAQESVRRRLDYKATLLRHAAAQPDTAIAFTGD